MSNGRVIEDLRQLPYVQALPRDGRLVPLQPFFDAEVGDWHLYVPHANRSLIRLADGESISGSYLARTAADPNRDLHFPLGTLIVRHLSYVGTLTALGHLENDVHRCAAVLEKYHLIWENRHTSDHAAGLLIESELEYLLLLLRSLYDLLQSVVCDLGRRLRRIDNPTRRGIQDLPGSFADVVMRDELVLDATVVAERFRMPEALATWYHAEAHFFSKLRKLRDGIAHHGHRASTVFETDWGFAVDPSDAVWTPFTPFLVGPRWSERLASMRGAFGGFIRRALEATDRLAAVLPTFVELPKALGSEVNVFVRSPFGRHLIALERLSDQPWEGLGPPVSS